MRQNQYTELIAGVWTDKPKFMNTVYAMTQPFVELQNQLSKLSTVFDLDSAPGDQLDKTGHRIGVSRYIDMPLTDVYFTLDDEKLGFDLGVWKKRFDPDTGMTILDDEMYRLVLRAKIAANHWDGTNESLKTVLDILFEKHKLFFADNQDMSFTMILAGRDIPPIVIQLLTWGYIEIKPAGVRVKFYVISNGPAFGFDSDSDYISGFDISAWGAIFENRRD